MKLKVTNYRFLRTVVRHTVVTYCEHVNIYSLINGQLTIYSKQARSRALVCASTRYQSSANALEGSSNIASSSKRTHILNPSRASKCISSDVHAEKVLLNLPKEKLNQNHVQRPLRQLKSSQIHQLKDIVKLIK